MPGIKAERHALYRKAVSDYTAQTIDQYGIGAIPIHPSCYEARYVNERTTIDHIIPISQGFKRDVDPVWMGSLTNLRRVPWSWNVDRGARWDDDAKQRHEMYLHRDDDLFTSQEKVAFTQVRTTDPETSRAAARLARQSLSEQAWAVLELFADHDRLSQREVEAILKRDLGAYNNARRRCTDLARKGHITLSVDENGDVRTETTHGKVGSRQYELTPVGRTKLMHR